MTQTTSSAPPVVTVKPQPNVYTVLLMACVVLLVVTIVITLANLMGNVQDGSGYGLTFEQVLTGKDLPGLPAVK